MATGRADPVPELPDPIHKFLNLHGGGVYTPVLLSAHCKVVPWRRANKVPLGFQKGAAGAPKGRIQTNIQNLDLVFALRGSPSIWTIRYVGSSLGSLWFFCADPDLDHAKLDPAPSGNSPGMTYFKPHIGLENEFLVFKSGSFWTGVRRIRPSGP